MKFNVPWSLFINNNLTKADFECNVCILKYNYYRFNYIISLVYIYFTISDNSGNLSLIVGLNSSNTLHIFAPSSFLNFYLPRLSGWALIMFVASHRCTSIMYFKWRVQKHATYFIPFWNYIKALNMAKLINWMHLKMYKGKRVLYPYKNWILALLQLGYFLVSSYLQRLL